MLGVFLGALAGLMLAVPSSAFAAGVYTWTLASNFTATAPGANPDHDSYGATPWSYLQAATPTSLPSAFLPLTTFGTAVQGGLAGWSALANPTSGPFVGINPTGAAITKAPDTFPAHTMALEPPSTGGLVAVGWTSPLSASEAVTINGTVVTDSSPVANCTYSSWQVLNQAGTVLAHGTTGTTSSTISAAPTVAPGATIYVTVSTTAANAACDATALSLQLSAPGAAPAPAITSPTPNSSSTSTEPTISGTATNLFGDSGQVTVRLYSGSSASGTPVQTVTAARTGTSWSAALTKALAVGTYTAQAEQDDLASPADKGLSAPVTFAVGAPVVTLYPLGSAPQGTSTPTLTGAGGTDPSDQTSVAVLVYAGTSTIGPPLRTITVPLGANGQFTAQVTPALPDGTYTATALQGDASGTTGVSNKVTFNIDTQPPAVTLTSPGMGAHADVLQLVFSGAAGVRSFDSNAVTVLLYRGTKAAGTPFRTLSVPVKGATWSATWPGALRAGTYTAQVQQTDAAGHVGVSAPHTFRVVALPPVIGPVTFTRSGRVRIKVACNEPAGDSCSGTILVVTRGDYQPVAGGPSGPLTVMFAYVKVPGASTPTITRTLLPKVAATLGRQASVPVTVFVNMHPSKGKAFKTTVRETLRRS
jgi:hypothetical protein